MTWHQPSQGVFTTTAQGLEIVLEPTAWSVWTLPQAQAEARRLANQAARERWAKGSLVRLTYRPA